MSALFASGHVVDIILAVIAVEALWLMAQPRRAERLLSLLPGVLLLLALRAALTGAAWWVVAAWLTASFPVHLADLWRRGRG